jgi:hypothetical protein
MGFDTLIPLVRANEFFVLFFESGTDGLECNEVDEEKVFIFR